MQAVSNAYEIVDNEEENHNEWKQNKSKSRKRCRNRREFASASNSTNNCYCCYTSIPNVVMKTFVVIYIFTIYLDNSNKNNNVFAFTCTATTSRTSRTTNTVWNFPSTIDNKRVQQQNIPQSQTMSSSSRSLSFKTLYSSVDVSQISDEENNTTALVELHKQEQQHHNYVSKIGTTNTTTILQPQQQQRHNGIPLNVLRQDCSSSDSNERRSTRFPTRQRQERFEMELLIQEKQLQQKQAHHQQQDEIIVIDDIDLLNDEDLFDDLDSIALRRNATTINNNNFTADHYFKNLVKRNNDKVVTKQIATQQKQQQQPVLLGQGEVSSSSATTETKTVNTERNTVVNSNITCRVVALSDGKIRLETLPEKIILPPRILHQMETIYYAKSRETIKPVLQYINQQRKDWKQNQYQEHNMYIEQQQQQQQHEQQTRLQLSEQQQQYSLTETIRSSFFGSHNAADKEQKVVSTIRTSLEDAGYKLLSKRDLALCDSLNAGYLLRLSILPELSKLDSSLGKEFYPERFLNDNDHVDDDLLFKGKVLIYYRGYSQEVSQGRLILPKLDYLQASLVERLMNTVKVHVDRVERIVLFRSSIEYRNALAFITKSYRSAIKKLPKTQNVIMQQFRTTLLQASYTTTKVCSGSIDDVQSHFTKRPKTRSRSRRSLKLFETFSRYSSPGLFVATSTSPSSLFTEAPNPTDPIRAFTICEKQIAEIQNKYDVNGVSSSSYSSNDNCCNDNECYSSAKNNIFPMNKIGDISISDAVDKDIYELLNNRNLRCPYDNTYENRDRDLPPMQLLQRVSLGNLVDLFTKQGRKKLVQAIVSESKLVEPTYEEVVVVWRPKREKGKKPTVFEELGNHIEKVSQIRPPKFVYDIADMFDIEGLPEQPIEVPTVLNPPPVPIEIRAFQDVPMANIKAVLPNTKLKLGPVDALRFDLVSIVGFLAIVSSVRFDKPFLDIIALVTVVFWFIRTIYRYSNKLARYDLVVKTFLTSKISHRNVGAIEYLANEAASQRASRAALVHYWLSTSRIENNPLEPPFDRIVLQKDGRTELNNLLKDIKETPINIDAALNDLIELDLLSVAKAENTITSSTSTPQTTTDINTMMNTYAASTPLHAPPDHRSQSLNIIQYEADVVKTLKRKWDELFVVDFM
jgi:Protein of unknown function (DUF3754)